LNSRYGCPYTAFPVPHLRPLGHLSVDHNLATASQEKLAEGRGFEPPRDSSPYPISSRTPSTGLGHPSASTRSVTCRVSHLCGSSGRRRRVHVKSTLHSPGGRCVRPDGPETDERGAESCSGSAQFPGRSQVYPGLIETRSEGTTESAAGSPRRPIAGRSTPRIVRAKRRMRLRRGGDRDAGCEADGRRRRSQRCRALGADGRCGRGVPGYSFEVDGLVPPSLRSRTQIFGVSSPILVPQATARPLMSWIIGVAPLRRRAST
jgi:hypothetical protein